MIEFIVNPNSRGQKGARIWSQVKEELKRQGKTEGRDYRLHITTRVSSASGIAAELVKNAKAKPLTIAVLGGDGTLNEVINGLNPGADVVLGYIPTGSGNDFARSVKIGADIRTAVNHILNPCFYKNLDYGITVTGENETEQTRRFLVSSGIGYDAAVCHRLLYSRVKEILLRIHLEKLEYLLVGIAEIVRSEPMNGTLIVDGNRKIELEQARFVSAQIHPYEGGGFCFAPQADPSDGKLDLCVVNRCGKGKFVLALVCSLFRRHNLVPGVELIRCDCAEIKIAEAFPVHTDGESAGKSRTVRFSCGQQKVRLIAWKDRETNQKEGI